MRLVSVGPVETCSDQDDIWHGSQRLRTCLSTGEIVWTAGTSKVRRRFGRTIIGVKEAQSVFAVFENELCACTLFGDAIQVNAESGSEWDISLPFRAKRLWANSAGGLLVERWIPPSRGKDPSLAEEPLLFSVSHPLDEAKPVDLESEEEVVWVFDSAAFLLTYSAKTRTHTLWRMHCEELATAAARDREDFVLDIVSEVSLTPVRSFPPQTWPSKVSKAFIAHTAQGEAIICVTVAESLFGMDFNADERLDFQLDRVVDATCVSGSTEQGKRDLVVLRPDGTMELYRGPMRLCQLILPFDSSSAARQVASFQKFPSNDECLDVCFAGNTTTRSVTTRVAVRARPLQTSEACETVLRAAKESNATLGLALAVDVCVRTTDNPFDALVSVISELLSSDSSSLQSMQSYDRLLSSDFHFQQEEDGLFPAHSTVTQMISPSSSSSSPLLSKSVIVAGTLIALFQSVHLAYEDAKLNVLQAPVLRKLGCFLGGLSRALFISTEHCRYEDFYRRDLGKQYVPIALPLCSQTQSPTLPPPDIIETLLHVLAGQTPPSDWKSGSYANKLIRVVLNLRLPEDGHSRALAEMVACGMDLAKVETFPVGVQIVIRELLQRCRENPPPGLSRQASVLIGREDMFLSSSNEVNKVGQDEKNDDFEDDDFKVLQHVTKLRFGRDHRVKEAFRLLDSAVSPLLVVKRRPEMTDHDLLKAQQNKLKRMITKSMAGTLGRGALLLFTKRVHEKTVKIPELAKTGRIPPQNVQVQLDDTHAIRSNWPAFHNGVCAGLSRFPRLESTKDLTRSWILFNKAKPPTDAHAGVLLALGLNRDLGCLTMADTYEHIEPGHDLTSIAILLGLGCAKAGTCDANVRKTLTLHVPSLFPQEFSNLDVVPSTVQSAALAGLGLLYRGTCNRLMCEFFLEEMAKSPASDTVVDQRNSYSLSAGLGLGMVALGFGAVEGGLAGLADLEIEDRLHLLIGGGPVSKFAHQIHALGGGDEGGMDDTARVAPISTRQAGGDDDGGSGSAGGGGMHGMGGGAASLTADRDPKCSRVLEGTHVNTDATSPGATMALGLIYLKSNDSSVASRLASPQQTRFLLENIRPDFLMYRVWARNLVMWDSVQPDFKWIQDQIPAFLYPNSTRSSSVDAQDAKFFAQARAYIAAGAALGLGCRFAGTLDRRARDCLLRLFHVDSEDDALLFATVDATCSDVCYSVIALAVGLVMAGSGDLETLRTLRAFRKNSMRYGAQQMSALAVGFLFLGAGKMSFSRSDEAIAALVCSIFPTLADSPEDNSCYLQALRHLYVLATEQRAVEAFDSDTGEPCYAPLIVQLRQQAATDIVLCENELSCAPELGDLSSNEREMKDDDSLLVRVVAPALLPPLEMIESVRVESARYWPLTLNPRKLPLHLVVKLRADQLPYQMDPRGLSSLSARPRPRVGTELLGSLRDFANKSPFLLAFAKHVPDRFETIYESLVHDSLDALPCILEIASFQQGGMTPLQAEQLRFLKRYYACLGGGPKRLVSDRLLVVDPRMNPNKLKAYVKEGLLDDDAFAVSLNLAGIPKLALLNLSAAPTMMMQGLDPDALLEICDALIM